MTIDTRFLLGLCLTGSLVIAVMPLAGQSPQGQPTFRSRSTAVNVNVSVRRDKGPVSGLTAADFAVTDNGVAQRVALVSYEVVPIDVTLVIDLSASTSPIVDEILRDATGILGLLRPIDRVRVLTIDTVVREVLPLQPVSSELRLPPAPALPGLSPVRDAIMAALMTHPDPDRRRLLVVISDGEDSRSVIEAQTAYDVSRRSDAVLHLVLVGGWISNLAQPAAASAARPTAQRLPNAQLIPPVYLALESFTRRALGLDEWKLLLDAAVVSGGTFHGGSYERIAGGTTDAVAVFRDIFEEFRQSYVVQYEPENVPASGWHELSVKVKGVDAKGVRARKGYFAGSQ